MPQPGTQEVLVQMLAYGVCRTGLHIIDGDLPPRHPGMVPGQEVVERVVTRSPARGPRGRRCRAVALKIQGRANGGCADQAGRSLRPESTITR